MGKRKQSKNNDKQLQMIKEITILHFKKAIYVLKVSFRDQSLKVTDLLECIFQLFHIKSCAELAVIPALHPENRSHNKDQAFGTISFHDCKFSAKMLELLH